MQLGLKTNVKTKNTQKTDGLKNQPTTNKQTNN